IDIRDPDDWSAVDDVIHRLDEFAWIVFSSTNGVERFLNRLFALGRDMRALGTARLAAVGPGTAARLGDYHLRADLVPGEYRAEALAAALAPQAKGARVLLVRASRGREVLAEELRQAGAEVEQVVAYQSLDVAEPQSRVMELLEAG